MKPSKLIAAPHLREPWGHPGDGKVIVHSTLSDIKGTTPLKKENLGELDHRKPLYKAAKYQNDMDAAVQLVDECVCEEKIELVVEHVASAITQSSQTPRIVFPHSAFDDEDGDGGAAVETGEISNAIPFALAGYMAGILGGEIETDVVQAARVSRTKLNTFTRFLWQPKFDGLIRERHPYVIVDDVATNGGTLAALRGHIIRNGGTVVCCTVLAHTKGKDVDFAVSADTLTDLRLCFGDGIGEYWKDTIGHELHCLTDAEGKKLIEWADQNCVSKRGTLERLHDLGERIVKAAATGQ